MKQETFFDAPPPKSSFINTSRLKGKVLAEANMDAALQEKCVLQIFKDKSPLTPRQCHTYFEKRHGAILLTSIRRSITNLTARMQLNKTHIQVKGPFKNRPEYVWKIA